MSQETPIEAIRRLQRWLDENKAGLDSHAIKDVIQGEPLRMSSEELYGRYPTWPRSYLDFVSEHGATQFLNPDFADPGDQFSLLTPVQSKPFQFELEETEDLDGRDAEHLLVFATSKHNPLEAYVFNTARTNDVGEMAIESWTHGEYVPSSGAIVSFGQWVSTQVDYIISQKGEFC